MYAARSVHPHVRGDDTVQRHGRTALRGSPPRAWGRPRERPQPSQGSRFTPTCVGTTWTNEMRAPCGTVHPHVRGDDGGFLDRLENVFGSPPRAWGRRSLCRAQLVLVRFTPTCVGTTVRGATKPHRVPVHPHVRGDDGMNQPPPAHSSGSPPRAWGRQVTGRSIAREERFTPTCVGTTSCPSPARHLMTGSPPRAWGRLIAGSSRAETYRFTPTCVGTTTWWSQKSENTPVHPHVRGDDGPIFFTDTDQFGSPPRAWGRHLRRHDERGPLRFTPTCVGTTSATMPPNGKAAVHPHVRGDDSRADGSRH